MEQLDAAVRLGIVSYYQHNEPKARYIKGQLTYVKRSGTDFSGAFERRPFPPLECHFAIECKSIKGDRLPRSMIETDQEKHLDAVARSGGLALLAGEYRVKRERIRFFCPWLEVPWKVINSAESVLLEDVEQWLEQPGGKIFLFRWHKGGPRSGSWCREGRRIYPTE
jgi:hypothetical protein